MQNLITHRSLTFHLNLLTLTARAGGTDSLAGLKLPKQERLSSASMHFHAFRSNTAGYRLQSAGWVQTQSNLKVGEDASC